MQKKRFWILIGIGVFIVFFFILLSNILSVGKDLREIHPYVEYGFYVLSGVLFYVLILNPLRVILFAPTFQVSALLDDENKRHKIYKDAAKQLLTFDYLTEEDRLLLDTNINNKDELIASLKQIYQTTITKEINQLIMNNSKTVLVSTALSQNGNLDMLSVVAVNLKMIKEIVQLTGFRPSYANLGKLSVNVLVTSIIAEGIEELEISELLPNKISETMTDIPFLKTISSSILGGISNAMLTCRIGVVTRSYLLQDNQLLTKKEIRRLAYKESIKMMPIIIKDGLAVFPKGVASLFTWPFKRSGKNKEE